MNHEKNQIKNSVVSNKNLELNDFKELKIMINSIQKDIKNLIEKSNQEYLDLMYSNLKMEFLNSINGYMVNKIDPTLDQRMVEHCDMKNQCKLVFERYLNKHLGALNEDSISQEKIDEGKEELEDLQKAVTSKKDCDICFNEVSDIFETHVELVNSLKIYETQDNVGEQKISDINENEIVKNTLDPISNVQRLKILKSIAIEPQTFSSLSKLTSLRGGNLLFHLQKLQKSDLIFQKQDHGEYLITKKGFNTINTIHTLNNLIN